MKAFLRMHALKPHRWEKRDAATSLLALQYSEEDLGADITIMQLIDYFWCSRAWIHGRVDNPTDGFSEEEASAHEGLAFWRANTNRLLGTLDLGRDIGESPALGRKAGSQPSLVCKLSLCHLALQ